MPTSASRRTAQRSHGFATRWERLAQVALSPQPARRSELERNARAAEALPAPAAAHRAPLRHVANPTPEEPDAEICTSGSVGPRRATAGATRPATASRGALEPSTGQRCPTLSYSPESACSQQRDSRRQDEHVMERYRTPLAE